MDKLWTGRFQKQLEDAANDFNSSIAVDSRMYKEDILGSIAHVRMLGAQGIVSPQEAETLAAGLADILADIESGKLAIDPKAEDIHSFVEGELTARFGDTGKRLHTARSRNDQVAVDTRLYIKAQIEKLTAALKTLIKTVCDIAAQNKDTIMAGYTHLQMAQPVTFAEHLLAYAYMFLRDASRLRDCKARMDFSPLGCCALAGTTFPIDRKMTAKALGFSGIVKNSMDGVSDRDYCAELASALSLVMMHLSRFSEEIILWSSWEFKYIELDDGYSTGSSIMPQKKNPDIAELVRGKTGRVYGNLIGILTMLKGLPLAYNKDMQEDKEALFDSVDTALACLSLFSGMLATMTVHKENMERAAAKGFINATDCADYLVKKGMPFRTAYKITGGLIAYCIGKKKALEELSLQDFQEHSKLFESDIYTALDLKVCVAGRTSEGGPSAPSVDAQILDCMEELSKL